MPHDPAAILACHGQRAPRYTSYPTAPHFSDAVGTSGDDRGLIFESRFLHSAL